MLAIVEAQAGANSPFAVLTAIVAPAILTNACSVLSLGMSNRLGRVVDRTRVVTAEIKLHEPGDPDYQGWIEQLHRLQLRAQLLMSALRAVYAALGAFAAASLLSVVGGIAAYYQQPTLLRAMAIAAVAIGTFAVISLVRSSVVIVGETRIAIRNLTEEAKLTTHFHPAVSPPKI